MNDIELHETTINVMRKLKLLPDPWQTDVINHDHRRLLLNCSRQSGKTTVVAVLGLVRALARMMTRVLIVSRSLRQSREMFRLMTHYYHLLGSPSLKRLTAEELELENMSRIVCVPCSEDTIRGFAHVDLLVIDEAARVPDDLYRAVRPMLAVSEGQLIALSTPDGKHGWFYDAWTRGGDDFARIQISADQCPRISAAFLEQERRALGESWFRQEYYCSFEAVEGVVYPDFTRCVVSALPSPCGRGAGSEGAFLPSPPVVRGRGAGGEGDRIPRGNTMSNRVMLNPLTPNPSPPSTGERGEIPLVGGIDFGFRNPFAAVWGFVDRDDVLWLTGEHYAAEKPLSYHAERLPVGCTWYADPAGAGEIAELRRANFTVKPGVNSIRARITAVRARLESGRLRVLAGRCPNLIAEAGLYRWGEAENGKAEVPVDAHNHALAALRYLVMSLDRHSLKARPKIASEEDQRSPEQRAADERERRYREMEESDDPDVWWGLG
jgi:Terminase large subunit, T4likevirus-type, N-terminal/Terminase RNaseH-like domain